MNGFTASDRPRRFPPRSGAPGWPMDGLFEAMSGLRDEFERRSGGGRAGRGDVRAAILSLLAEQPMHGYQLIRTIEERSNGSWKPSPGSVYPTLQLLTDEGLIQAEEAEGRKTYSLTEEGRAEAEAATERNAPWETAPGGGLRGSVLRKAIGELAPAAMQVARSGSPEQIEQATGVLDEARRRLYSILAQD